MQKFFKRTTKTDKPVQMRRLILVFVGRSCQQVRFLTLRFEYMDTLLIQNTFVVLKLFVEDDEEIGTIIYQC